MERDGAPDFAAFVARLSRRLLDKSRPLALYRPDQLSTEIDGATFVPARAGDKARGGTGSGFAQFERR